MLSQLTCEMFEEHLNGMFLLREEAAPMNLELVEVTRLCSRRRDAREPFSLLFQAPEQSRHLPQKMYPIEHETMGVMNLFIVPIAPGTYEAVFS